MADGPQPPLWLSLQASHSPMRPANVRWNPFETSASPSAASTIWVPATAHQSLST
jgi:hypothetical protein